MTECLHDSLAHKLHVACSLHCFVQASKALERLLHHFLRHLSQSFNGKPNKRQRIKGTITAEGDSLYCVISQLEIVMHLVIQKKANL